MVCCKIILRAVRPVFIGVAGDSVINITFFFQNVIRN